MGSLPLLLWIISITSQKGIKVIVTGGYGLDALYGNVTRDHNDIDMFISEKDQIAFEEILSDLNFERTGKVIGESGKHEFISPDYGGFRIEYGFIERGEELISKEDRANLIPELPLGELAGTPILTPSLPGFKAIIELNNKLALASGAPEYPHREWMNRILSELKKKTN